MKAVEGCQEAVHPKTAVIAHLHELGHAKGRYRWTYRDGLDEKAKLEAAGFLAVWGFAVYRYYQTRTDVFVN